MRSTKRQLPQMFRRSLSARSAGTIANGTESQKDKDARVIQELKADVAELSPELEIAQQKVKDFKRLINESAALQEDVKVISIKSGKKLHQAFGQLNGMKKRRKVDGLEELANQLAELQQKVDSLREIRPETRSFFSRMFLGRVNVKMWTTKDKIRLRDEYNKFKFRTMWMYIAFPTVALYFHTYIRGEWEDTHWINVIHELWLLYYYITLAIRENILIVNGSTIRNWWLYHHYLAALGTVTLLLWPVTDTYLAFVPFFNYLAFYNGLIQLMQNWYHRKREYANRALGKLGHMDVTYKETLTDFPSELWIILPFLIFAHIYEIGLGIGILATLYNSFDPNTHWTKFKEELQMLASGIVAIIMGLGNFLSTWATINAKQGKARRNKASKQKKKDVQKDGETKQTDETERLVEEKEAKEQGKPKAE